MLFCKAGEFCYFKYFAMHWFWLVFLGKTLGLTIFRKILIHPHLFLLVSTLFLFLYLLKFRRYEKFVNGFETCEAVCFPSFFERCICFPSTQAIKYRNQTIFNFSTVGRLVVRIIVPLKVGWIQVIFVLLSVSPMFILIG